MLVWVKKVFLKVIIKKIIKSNKKIKVVNMILCFWVFKNCFGLKLGLMFLLFMNVYLKMV